MCKARALNQGTMIHLRNGLVVVKSENNYGLGFRVNLTRKTMVNGKVKYGITITNLLTGRHMKMQTYRRIADAWEHYKRLRGAYLVLAIPA